MTDDQLFPLAQKCASAYCSKFGSWAQFDDATQEACVFLLRNRTKWSLPENELRNRTVLALVRWYQNENGLRRKSRLQRVDFDVEKIEAEETENAARAVIEAALERFDEKELILDLITGAGRKQVAEKYGVRLSEVDRIYKEFKTELCKFSNKPVKGEIESCPLFYAIET